MSQTQVIETMSPPDIYLGPSPIHGRGVYAARDFKSGEVVEECPFLNLSAANVVLDFAFDFEGEKILPLGYGAIYNHDDTPNVNYVANAERGTMLFTARRAINMGEELLVDYGKKWWEDREYPKVLRDQTPRGKWGFAEWRNIIFIAAAAVGFISWSIQRYWV